MKKLFVLFAAAAFVLGAASCQKETPGGAVPEGNTELKDSSDDPMHNITVFVPSNDTKLAFSENGSCLDRKFSVDDQGQELIGCVNVNGEYKHFSYKINKVEEVTNGVSIELSKNNGENGVPSNSAGTIVHFIYAPGHSFNKISNAGVLELDLSVQHEGHIPAVMAATGTVGNDNKVTLKFKNLTSILAIVPPTQGSMLNDYTGAVAYSGCTFTSVKIEALTKAKLTIDESSGASVSDATVGEAEIKAQSQWTENSTIYSAVFPGNCSILATIKGVQRDQTAMGDFKYGPVSNVDVGDNAYIRIWKQFRSVTPKYPGTDKSPVQIGNIWWAPVNCGGDDVLYDWSAAQNNCPSGWRVPSKAELENLATTIGSWSGNGRYFNNNTLFFHAAGAKSSSGISYENQEGWYWSSTPDGGEHAIYMRFRSDDVHVYNNDNNGYRTRGMSVRCVTNAN